jgi:hypothetical protein
MSPFQFRRSKGFGRARFSVGKRSVSGSLGGRVGRLTLNSLGRVRAYVRTPIKGLRFEASARANDASSTESVGPNDDAGHSCAGVAIALATAPFVLFVLAWGWQQPSLDFLRRPEILIFTIMVLLHWRRSLRGCRRFHEPGEGNGGTERRTEGTSSFGAVNGERAEGFSALSVPEARTETGPVLVSVRACRIRTSVLHLALLSLGWITAEAVRSTLGH